MAIFIKIFVQCYSEERCALYGINNHVGNLYITGFITFVASVFLLFTTCLVKDQVTFIKVGTSTIDKKFKKKRKNLKD
jgi:hypothetical protein